MYTSLIVAPSESYALLATGNGERLERVGNIVVRRPDPNVLWDAQLTAPWDVADVWFVGDRDQPWQVTHGKEHLFDGWEVAYTEFGLTVLAEPTPFRHLGYFPEQHANWLWCKKLVKEIAAETARQPKVLNLFGYTGAASIVAAQAGASVCHVDASKPALLRGKHNSELSGAAELPIRWIHEDVSKFVAREIRRGSMYDVIMLDPPVFGRGSKGEIWRLELGLTHLLQDIAQILTPGGKLLLNFYATSLYPESVQRLAQQWVPQAGKLDLCSISIGESGSEEVLQTGFCLRS